ncbi:hypothetical protein HAX54_051400, partial [Datura stramonium]|nr:hypothetical protein [Datura stramonium]
SKTDGRRSGYGVFLARTMRRQIAKRRREREKRREEIYAVVTILLMVTLEMMEVKGCRDNDQPHATSS